MNESDSIGLFIPLFTNIIPVNQESVQIATAHVLDDNVDEVEIGDEVVNVLDDVWMLALADHVHFLFNFRNRCGVLDDFDGNKMALFILRSLAANGTANFGEVAFANAFQIGLIQL